MKLLTAVVGFCVLIAVIEARSIPERDNELINEILDDELNSVIKRGSSMWYAKQGKLFRDGVSRSFLGEDDENKIESVEKPHDSEKRFYGLYGLGGLYGYGLGFGYPFGFWGKRDTLDTESHEPTMTDSEITTKREEMMKDLIEAEKRYYELEDDSEINKKDVAEKKDVEKRFWGLYGGLYGLGLGYGYPFGYGLWGKRDTAEARQWGYGGGNNFNNNNAGGGWGSNFNNNNGKRSEEVETEKRQWGYGGGNNFNNNNAGGGWGHNFNNNNGKRSEEVEKVEPKMRQWGNNFNNNNAGGG